MKQCITVDVDNLQRIREEALVTQEKLTVPEEEEWSFAVRHPVAEPVLSDAEQESQEEFVPKAETEESVLISVPSPETPAGPWAELKQALSTIELQALNILLTGADFKAFADSKGVMVEVLADGINEKAMDCIGDGLMDEEFVLYEDYIEEVRKLVEE